ncbi:YeeE/YedE thiosulfate transporter family protein [Erythrobacter mangrovi]|uniref:YeeE/YedE family protein n=1 Tax=Erythrobacter mangrovi TaxID=2739433 RepID=A0A7D4CP39_9SPHN|nr:YeeE/YedE thiosulfate transporter family protein [Erythrobacter mangrovi]QKG72568.1 YeeE/YedE family protein [Erythrobacter mangrovi]
MTPATAFLFAVALLSAAVMGAAIQRGATCMVAAVDEALVGRSFGRAGALLEAALWVGGLIALIQLVGVRTPAPLAYAVSHVTVLGGMLLGLGAWVNRACVFGSVARIGSGQWAWLATPVGFFLGCLPALGNPGGVAAELSPAVLLVMTTGFVVLAAWRLRAAAKAPNMLQYLSHPHRATLMIAITFVSTTLTVGAWAYTDALAALARPMKGMDPQVVLRGVMALALLGGAIVGGRLARTFAPLPARPGDVLRCLAGGALMGIGAQLVPGGNDGLIMQGLPFLQPHAWVAVSAMVLTISVLITVTYRVARPN